MPTVRAVCLLSGPGRHTRFLRDTPDEQMGIYPQTFAVNFRVADFDLGTSLLGLN